MTVLTGADGELRYEGRKISKCRNWSITVDRPLIDTTSLADYDRNYRPGIRSANGTATCLYQPNDAQLIKLLNSIFDNDPAQGGTEPTFIFNRRGVDLNEIKETDIYMTNANQFSSDRIRRMPTRFKFNGFLTNISHPISVGAAQAINISFQACGSIDGRW